MVLVTCSFQTPPFSREGTHCWDLPCQWRSPLGMPTLSSQTKMSDLQMLTILHIFGRPTWAQIHGSDWRYLLIVLSLCCWTFPQEFLLKFTPLVGFGRYDNWVQTTNNSGLFSITTTHDQCLGAYSRYTNKNLNILQAYVAIWPASYWELFGQTVFLESRTHA